MTYELRICVVSGYIGRWNICADAYVYDHFGRVISHYQAQGRRPQVSEIPAVTEGLRSAVRAQAEDYVASKLETSSK